MKSKLDIWLAAASLCLAFANAASADIITVTVTGTVGQQYSENYAGLFGGGDLGGDAFTAVYRFDTSCNGNCFISNSSDAEGGSNAGDTSPLLSAVLTINNSNVTFSGGAYSEIQDRNGETYQNISDCTGCSYMDTVVVAAAAGAIPNSITTAFSYTVNPNTDYYDGTFGIEGSDGYIDTYGELLPTTVTLADASAVPGPIVGGGLPGLIMAGGGLLGWWRRKRKVPAAA